MALKWHVAHTRPLAEYVARDRLKAAVLVQLFEQRATFVVASCSEDVLHTTT